MTKFKVGDRVTFTVAVNKVDGDTVQIITNDGRSFWLPDDDVELSSRADTTFRDQAAIAALQGLVVRHGRDDLTDGNILGFSRVAFDFAEALDAERKTRDGGE